MALVRFIAKWLVFRAVLKRFWVLILLLAAAKRFLPWEKNKGIAG